MQLQCKGRDSPTEAGIVPVHGVTCPLHDFTSFNKKRRNTVVIVSCPQKSIDDHDYDI